MHQEKSRSKPSRWIRTVITIASVLLSFPVGMICVLVMFITMPIIADLLQYGLPLDTAPERSFTTKELLINLADMPPGWTVSNGPIKLKDDVSSKDASVIVFQADTNVVRRGAMQRAYRYHSASSAKRMYEKYIRPGQFGATPPGWPYQSLVADQSYFACYDYEGRTPLSCEWSGRYEEYVVVFGSWIIPGRMSLQDMERVVRAIDARMAHYLGKPYPDAPGGP